MRDRVWSARPGTSRFSPQAARGRAPASPTSPASVTCAGSWPPRTTAPPAGRRPSTGRASRDPCGPGSCARAGQWSTFRRRRHCCTARVRPPGRGCRRAASSAPSRPGDASPGGWPSTRSPAWTRSTAPRWRSTRSSWPGAVSPAARSPPRCSLLPGYGPTRPSCCRRTGSRCRPGTSPAPRPGGRADIRAYLQRLRDTGQPLPVFTGRQTGALACAHRVTQPGKTGPGRPLAHNRFIAGTLGVTAAQVTALLAAEPDVLEGVRFGAGAPLATPVTAQVGGRSWWDAIDAEDVMDLAVHLAAAALLTVAYLSGMRPQESRTLERGCCPAKRRGDGTVRYLITGRHFKGVTDEDGNTIPGGQTRSQPETVIEPVHRAITVLEKLTEGPLLFPRRFSKAAKPRAYLGDAMSVITANARIARFAAWANTLAAEHRREHEVIPADPDGAVTMRRFRRPAAWFINRQPGGRIALGIQYGHLRASFGESYGGQSRVDMLQILDLEQALATADTLTEAAGRLNDGEGVSGPAAGRYIAAAREFQAAYAGGFASKRQYRALLA